MGFKLTEHILEETKLTRIFFDEAKTKFLDITHRIAAMSYEQKERLMGNVFSIQGKAKRIKELQRTAEDDHRPDQDREQAREEMLTITRDVRLLTPPLVDYLGGIPDNIPPRPPAIAKWDLLDDFGDPLPITREVIMSLNEEMISKIAWELLGDTSPGESQGSGSSSHSAAQSKELSTVPV